MSVSADFYIEHLGLTKHVEGGAFKETYRSHFVLNQNCLTPVFNGDRNIATGIYFLLSYGDFSAFHRIKSDEMWHFYDGDCLSIYEIEANGNLITHKLGRDILNGEKFQLVIKAGSWFASRCEVNNGFSLVGCTVAPGFDFNDFELADSSLKDAFPQHRKLINELIR